MTGTCDYITASYLDVASVAIDRRFSSVAIKHLLSMVSRQKPSANRVSLTIHKGMVLDHKPLDAVPCTPSISVTEDCIWEVNRYKFCSWTLLIAGLRDMRDIHVYVSGDLMSAWVWPFRTVGSLLKLIAGHCGFCFLHGAGLSLNEQTAALIVGSSGTGKTLTFLNWVCRGLSAYHDDHVVIEKDSVIPHSTKICFWYDRYRAHPVLSKLLPELSKRDRRTLRLSRMLRCLSLGKASIAVSLDIGEYWPNSLEHRSLPVVKLIRLHAGHRLVPGESVDPQGGFVNQLIGDLRFTNMPILRWVNAVASLHTGHPLAKWESNLEATIRRVVQSSECFEIGVPSCYDERVFKSIEELLWR